MGTAELGESFGRDAAGERAEGLRGAAGPPHRGRTTESHEAPRERRREEAGPPAPGPAASRPPAPRPAQPGPTAPDAPAAVSARRTVHPPRTAEAHRAPGCAVPPPLWVEDPRPRRRLPDPVRAAAVRAGLVIAVTLVQAMAAFLCTLAGSWLAFPLVLSSVVSTVVATWSVLDIWVTRQVWNQRHGVVSVPSSSARQLRRERRRARREARAAARSTPDRPTGPHSGPRRLSHP